jgi:hypothetical protein
LDSLSWGYCHPWDDFGHPKDTSGVKQELTSVPFLFARHAPFQPEIINIWYGIILTSVMWKKQSVFRLFFPEVNNSAFCQSIHDLNLVIISVLLLTPLALKSMRRASSYLVVYLSWHTTFFFVYSTHPEANSYHWAY